MLKRIRTSSVVLSVCLAGLLVMGFAGSGHSDPLLNSLKHRFETLTSYSATITTETDDGTTAIRYDYEKAGTIVMTFISPHEGATLSYRADTGLAQLKPFQSMPFVSMTLSPQNPLITSPGGHTIDASHMGNLIDTLILLSENGTVRSVAEASDTHQQVIFIRGNAAYTVNGIHAYRVAVDLLHRFPIHVTAYDLEGHRMETMVLTDLVIDPSH